MDDASGTSTDPERPLWLGSLARRGVGRGGEGWREPEVDSVPRWLGSLARRGGQQRPAGAEDDPDAPAWLGSNSRRLLAGAAAPGPEQAVVVQLSERREHVAAPPQAAPGTRTAVGELGMTLRVA